MHRHMDAPPAAGLHEHERPGQRGRSAGARELRRGAGDRGGPRLLLHRARPSRPPVPGRHSIHLAARCFINDENQIPDRDTRMNVLE